MAGGSYKRYTDEDFTQNKFQIAKFNQGICKNPKCGKIFWYSKKCKRVLNTCSHECSLLWEEDKKSHSYHYIKEKKRRIREREESKSSLPWWFKYFLSWDQIVDPQPQFYKIDLTKRCNLKCSWCEYKFGHTTDPKDDMSWELFSQFFGNAWKENLGIEFSGGGEPTLWKHWDELCKFLSEWDLIGLALVTNGMLLDKVDKFIESIKHNDNFWIRISLNERPVTMELLNLLSQYPKKIGISLIYKTPIEKGLCLVNYDILKDNPNVKFIRFKEAMGEKLDPYYPPNCVGRKVYQTIEPDGTISYCCHARYMKGKRIQACNVNCTYYGWDLNKINEANPNT